MTTRRAHQQAARKRRAAQRAARDARPRVPRAPVTEALSPAEEHLTATVPPPVWRESVTPLSKLLFRIPLVGRKAGHSHRKV